MIDSHSHIHDFAYDADRDEVLARAREAGVSLVVAVGTDVAESRRAVDIAHRYDAIVATVALHPEEYSKCPDEVTMKRWIAALESLALDERVVAIGECGLDYHAFGGVAISDAQKKCQQRGFRDHLDLALRAEKPVIIHARESYDDVLSIISEYHKRLPAVILHCYQGDTEVTAQFLSLGENIFFSFAGNLTYPVKKARMGTKDDLRESAKLIPLERLLVETDAPYLAPQAVRGTRNEPANVVHTAHFLAEFIDVPYVDFDCIVTANAWRVFGCS